VRIPGPVAEPEKKSSGGGHRRLVSSFFEFVAKFTKKANFDEKN